MSSSRPGAAQKPPAAAAEPAWGIVKRGAADLKQRLQVCAAEGRPLVLLWTSAEAEKGCKEARRALSSIAAGLPDVALAEAPADMSKANGALAAAMAVVAFPSVTVFRSMQVRGGHASDALVILPCTSAQAAARLLQLADLRPQRKCSVMRGLG